MKEEERPDPETLLKAIQISEDRRGRGRLKIFLGMAAGTGKTYTMLEAAQKKMGEGVNVVAGVVETHGRPETEKLLAPLPAIPQKTVSYKERDFKELDVDEIIRQRPQLVLVDELAHSNIPGSKHVKRWQDVVEILEAGIDVFTTVNIQHIESYKDIIEGIVGIKIWETVPDSMLERAADIEFVDITPAELLQRLKEGKVYTGDLPQVALKNFFQEDRLTALREIALRFTAEKVDQELHDMIGLMKQGKVWRPRERLLVCINHQPYAQQLIRSARQLAFTLHAPWIAVYVDTGNTMDAESSALLAKNFTLARELGADVITTQDIDVAKGIQRVAEQKEVTQIIIGKNVNRSILNFFRRSLADKLSRITSGIDVHIIRQVALHPPEKKSKIALVSSAPWTSYIHILFWSAVVTFFNSYIVSYVGYKVVGNIFLLSILFFSLFFKRGPLFFCSLIYFSVWNYFFIPKIVLLNVSTAEDLLFSILFLLAALITGTLTNQVKKRENLLLKKEKSTQAIYDIVKEISRAPSTFQLIAGVKEKLSRILHGECEIIVHKRDGMLGFDGAPSLSQNEKEQAVANWVFKNGKEAGWSTLTLPSAKYLYIPLKGFKETVGVLAFHSTIHRYLLPEEKNFLYTVAQQLATFLERFFSEERERHHLFIKQIEQIYSKILQSISHELYHPFKIIQNAIDDFKGEKVVYENIKLFSSVYKIEQTAESLMRIAENAAAMAKLSSGLFAFERSSNDIHSIIEKCCDEIKLSLQQHRVKLSVQKNLPLISCDASLMTILLHHLLTNAVEYSPPQSTIEIGAEVTNETFILSVADEGKGIPEDTMDLIFEKFYRVQGTISTGLGLGLSIVKSIADIHHGTIRVQNRHTGGTIFSLLLPLE